jgi:flavin reductase (DIM6/NTAB) family NADH-FMN oxidoreductase RutF
MNAIDRQISGVDVNAADFRGTMRRLAGAVSVVTSGNGATRAGLTASSVTSLSVDPPTVLVCVNRTSSALSTIRSTRQFAINVLSETQQPIADRFAGRHGVSGNDRYAGAEWTQLFTGAPVLLGALAVIDCVLEEVIERHSHAILIGRVKAVAGQGDAGPLIYWDGAYRRLSDEG